MMRGFRANVNGATRWSNRSIIKLKQLDMDLGELERAKTAKLATGTTLPALGKVFPYTVEIPNRGP